MGKAQAGTTGHKSSPKKNQAQAQQAIPPVALPVDEPMKKASKYVSLSEKAREVLPRIRGKLLALRDPLLDEIQSSCSYSRIVEVAVVRFERQVDQSMEAARR